MENPDTPTLTLWPQAWVLPLPAGRSLLDAAQDAGVRLPRSCRNGTCRMCLCRVRAGRVRHRIAWPGLSAEELADGWVLPCVAEAEPETDVVLEAPAARRAEPPGLGDGGA